MAGIGEADHPVRAECLGGVQVGCGDQFVGFVPVNPHETAHATLAFIALGFGLVLDDAAPGIHRRQGLARFTPEFQQALRINGYLTRFALYRYQE